MIIALVGRKQSGKDTIGKILVEKYGFVRFSIASKIKEICRELFDVDIPEVHDEIKPEHRRLIQQVANKMREIDENVWINYLIKTMSRAYRSHINIVITDVRFLVEVQKLKQLGAQIWKLNRRIDNDTVEDTVDNIPNSMFDVIIDNKDWTYEQFIQETEKIIQERCCQKS